MEIAILITSHNRRETTLKCLSALYNQKEEFDVFLVDDGSTDGTSDAIKKDFPLVNLIFGNGNLYWNRGMRLAWETAVQEGNYDFYLWLNDDVRLFKNAVAILKQSFNKAKELTGKDAIMVGSTLDEDTRKISYGGRIKKNYLDFLATQLVPPGDDLLPIDTFNGNIVFISNNIFQKMGFLDDVFNHGFGDTDYGLRARKSKIPMFIVPDFLGYCSRDTDVKAWADPKIPLKKRLEELNTPLGLPLKQWKIYTKRHAGFFWPIIYFKLVFRVFFPSVWGFLKFKK